VACGLWREIYLYAYYAFHCLFIVTNMKKSVKPKAVGGRSPLSALSKRLWTIGTLGLFFLCRGGNFQAAWTPPATINFGAKKLCFFLCFLHNSIRYFLYFYSIIFSLYFQKSWGGISYNVPAVCDVFAVAIKETVGFQQPQKCVWSERGNGA
jgi:hypothetical protein